MIGLTPHKMHDGSVNYIFPPPIDYTEQCIYHELQRTASLGLSVFFDSTVRHKNFPFLVDPALRAGDISLVHCAL